MDTSSLERIVPDELHEGEGTGLETLRLHLERYEFSAKHVKPGHLLDIACGVGYGSYFLATEVQDLISITSVDLSEQALSYAKTRYNHPKINYIHHDALTFGDGEAFDTIVSLETIEHLPEPGRFIKHLKTLLRPGGVLIGSVPTTPSVDANPHHLNDFTETSFRQLFLQEGFSELASFRQIQPYSGSKVILRREKRAHNLRKNLPLFYLQNPTSLLKRIVATLRYGFNNHYITICWKLAQQSGNPI